MTIPPHGPEGPRVLRPLTSTAALDAAIASSATAPVLLFKHSETCGMSFQAREEVLAALERESWDTDVYLVSVQRNRDVSNAIADVLRTRHASPQALLVSNGEVRWQATHLAITADALERAVGRERETA